MRSFGWATGYALSIYGTEYTHQCPFQTGNGYGDGRAISVFEGVFNGKRWEMQLKGGGPTPYCRGADGRAVLRSSVREFLAQEYMHALGVPTSRSLTLYVSQTETVSRPWYAQESKNFDPDILVDNPVAISTRVAPSFCVGQLELFARRTRNDAFNSLEELHMIVAHLIEREYLSEIDQSLRFTDQIVELAEVFGKRLTSLVANWLSDTVRAISTVIIVRQAAIPSTTAHLASVKFLILNFSLGLEAATIFLFLINLGPQKLITTCFGRP